MISGLLILEPLILTPGWLPPGTKARGKHSAHRQAVRSQARAGPFLTTPHKFPRGGFEMAATGEREEAGRA